MKRTAEHVHLTHVDGIEIDRTIYEKDGKHFIKINGMIFDLWNGISICKNWRINYIW